MAYTIDEMKLKPVLHDGLTGDWIKTAAIPADHSTTGGLTDQADNLEKPLMSDFDD